MPTTTPHQDRTLAAWLFLCCLLIYAMVILGGVTRLTGSGLSMVEWDPVFGIIPPLSLSDWEAVFHQYKQTPEFQKINVGMDLEGFKSIFWYEYSHRVLGRTIGLVFLIPFVVFLFRRRIPRTLAPRLLGLFFLGGLQGFMGWYMVMSGLVDNPHVSQYRLTAHLGLAFAIYAFMLWIALDLWISQDQVRYSHSQKQFQTRTFLVGLLAIITMISGGFVAGLKAGYAYNTFPLMDGHWVPPTLFDQQPLWRNFFENIATVQFDHRLLAMLTFAAIAWLWWRGNQSELNTRSRGALHLLLAATVLQICLGISTLLMGMPVALAASHQGGALLVLSALVFLLHALHRNR